MISALRNISTLRAQPPRLLQIRHQPLEGPAPIELIEEQLEELRTKKNEILTRARIAKTQQKIEKTVSGRASSTASILDAVMRLEGKVEETEAELEIRRGMDKDGVSPSLERRLDELERDGEIEKRLAELKKRISASKA